tara:strand:- start:308 stop:790 length:483 start_codon:yes stop_codon:yes gene_type:complete
MPPVSPGQPSSFGSVFADSPGLLRENGFTFVYTVKSSAADQDLPICSGTAPATVTDFQPVLAPLLEGDSLNIYGIQAAHAGAGTNPMVVAIRVGDHGATDPILCVATSNRYGPWFQHFELPLQVKGTAAGTNVWIDVMDEGTQLPVYNRVTLECIVVRKS